MSNSKIAETYDYKDESGVLLYQNVRYEPKAFRQRRPNGDDWLWNLDGVRRVLYRLPELLDPMVNRNGWVFFCEGEKDVDNVRRLGLIATTSGGTTSWRAEFAEFLNDRHVAILPHNDTAGKKFAKKAALSLTEIGVETRIIKLPGMSESSDVSDWLNGGETKDKLLDLIDQAKPFTLPVERIGTAFNLTDAGNGERFAAQHSDKMKYCCDWGKWLFFDGRRWNLKAGTEVANQMAVETARNILLEAEGKSYEQRGPILKWSYQSEGKARLTAMLDCARWVSPIPVYAKNFDTDLWLLNCLNGTIDLRTGKLRPHNSNDMITKLCPVDYDPNTTLELWDEFLETTTDSNNEIREFLQQAAGYSATGDTSEEKLFFIHGDTATGKSTFLEAIKSVLGDYAQTADFETFLHRKMIGTVRNDIAKLAGSRLVVSIEVEEGKRLAEGLVKMLTGGDTVSARFLYQESFEFAPQFTLWLAANAAPKIRDDDAAMWRRILRLPFNHCIPKPDQDPEIKATLKNPKVAGPAILAWVVKGCLKWQKSRLIVPEIIEKSTEEYRQSQDPMREFFEDDCEFDPNAFVPVAELRGAYDQHCKDNGTRYPLGPRQFNERLRAKECEYKQKRYSNETGTETVGKCWLGVTLKTNSRYDSEDSEGNQGEKQEVIPF